MIRLARFTLGRALIHAGLRAMPRGRVRSELYSLFDIWSTQVRKPLPYREERL